MRTILLLGELGKKFGKKFEMDVKNPAEAVRALCANFPNFQKYLLESGERNVFYKVLVGKEARTADKLHDPSGKSVIKIVPVIGGAGGRNPFTFIAAAVLIIASFALNYVFPGNPVSPYLFNAGVSMAIGGVVQMLTPLPKTPNQEDRPENKPSFFFNGSINTSAQGYPVPVGYGRMIVGSAVISAGITVDELEIE